MSLLVNEDVLGIDSLWVTDLTITKIHGMSFIQVTDLNKRIIRFRYTEKNTVTDV